MIEQLVPRVFAIRDMAHKAHWRTGSDAQHRALGEFYDAVIPAIDAVVEMHQGMFGLIEPDDKAELPTDFVRSGPPGTHYPTMIAQTFRDEADWIETNRELLSSGVGAIGNLLDGLTGIYLKAAYKLENLS
ncbi:MAG TPA: hypothetical protein VK149_12290 [Sideroxyarcus sp.]|nr:hypothetical protein [Sideroxyarcus sp.]